MGFSESSTISVTNLEPTTSTVTNNVLTGSTTVGATTSTGVALAIDKDNDGNLYFDKKKVGATAVTTSVSSSLLLSGCTGLPEAYAEEAEAIKWTAKQTEETNYLRDKEELFAALSRDKQIEILLKINQKIEAATTEQVTTARHR